MKPTRPKILVVDDTPANLVAMRRLLARAEADVFEAASGKNLWHFQTGSPIYASPVTYLLDGRQFLVLGSGTTVYALALPPKR